MRYLIIFLLLLPLAPIHAQSGWVKAPGQTYLQASYQGFVSNQYYNPLGERLTTETFRQQSLQFYGEYGLTQRWDLILSMPLYRFNSFTTTTWAHGIGDLRVELKYGLLTGKIPVAISIAPELPTGPNDNFATNRERAFEQINLPTGDGEWNIWTTLAASHSFYPLPLYLSTHAAFNYRTGYQGTNFRNQIKYGVELGYQPTKSIWLIGRAGALVTIGDPTTTITVFPRGDGTTYMSGSLAASYQFSPQWSLVGNLQGYFDGWHARTNIYTGTTFTLGFAWEPTLPTLFSRNQE